MCFYCEFSVVDSSHLCSVLHVQIAKQAKQSKVYTVLQLMCMRAELQLLDKHLLCYLSVLGEQPALLITYNCSHACVCTFMYKSLQLSTGCYELCYAVLCLQSNALHADVFIGGFVRKQSAKLTAFILSSVRCTDTLRCC